MQDTATGFWKNIPPPPGKNISDNKASGSFWKNIPSPPISNSKSVDKPYINRQNINSQQSSTGSLSDNSYTQDDLENDVRSGDTIGVNNFLPPTPDNVRRFKNNLSAGTQASSYKPSLAEQSLNVLNPQFIMPTVTTTAKRESLPVIQQPPMSEKDFVQNRALNIPQQAMINADDIRKQNQLQSVSNLVHKMSNPLGVIKQGVESGVEQGMKGLKQYLQSGTNPNEKSLSDKTLGIIDMKPGQIEGLGNMASGAFKTAMSLYPGLAVANIAASYITPVAENIGGQIGGEEGKKIAGIITQIGTIAPMGLPMVIGMIANIGGSELAGKILQGTKLNEDQRGLIKEAAGQLGFLLGAIGTGIGEGIVNNVKDNQQEAVKLGDIKNQEAEQRSQAKKDSKNDEYITNELNRQFLNAKRNKKIFDEKGIVNYSDQIKTADGKAKLENLYNQALSHNQRMITRNPDTEIITPELKGKENAIQQRRSETMGTHERGSESLGGQSESSGVGQNQQGDETAGILNDQIGENTAQEKETSGEIAQSKVEPVPLKQIVEEEKQQKIEQRTKRASRILSPEEYQAEKERLNSLLHAAPIEKGIYDKAMELYEIPPKMLNDEQLTNVKNALEGQIPASQEMTEIGGNNPDINKPSEETGQLPKKADLIKQLEPQRKTLENQYGKLEDLSDTELNNLVKANQPNTETIKEHSAKADLVKEQNKESKAELQFNDLMKNGSVEELNNYKNILQKEDGSLPKEFSGKTDKMVAQIERRIDYINNNQDKGQDIFGQKGQDIFGQTEADKQNEPKSNRIISDEAYQKAKDYLDKRKDEIKNQRGSGLNLKVEDLKAFSTIGAYHVESGLRNFRDWGNKMIEDFGDEIKPHLLDIWRQAKKDYPDTFNNETNGETSKSPYELAKENNDYTAVGSYHINNLKQEMGDKADIYPIWRKRMIQDFGLSPGQDFRKVWRAVRNEPDKISNETVLPEEKKSLPEKPAVYEPTLNVGFNPNVDKFYAEDIKPGVGKIKAAINATIGTIQKIPNYLSNVFQSAFPVISKFGDQPYAEVIKGIHKPEVERLMFNNTQSRIFDANFNQLESFYSKYPKKVIDDFNLSRGNPSRAEELQLKENALKRLPKELKDPKLHESLKEVSDWNYNYAKQNGVDFNYFEDYFYGAYEDSPKVSKFLDYWQSTENYKKEKIFPTIADATAWGLKLRDNNPITNLRKEADAIARKVGFLDIQKYNEETNASYMVKKGEASLDQVKNWEKIHDNVFKDYLFDPTYAKFVNNLISTNKLSSSFFLKGLRNFSYGLQQVKFIGSIFHFVNMAKHAIAANTGGILNPKGFADFVSGFKKYSELDPKYQEFVKLGGEHKYSIEAQSESQMTKFINKISSGNYLGGILKVPGTVLEQKWIPASPGFIKWMFEDYIPTLKFERYKDDIAIREKQLGRPLTDGEKIASIRRIQQFYGEMNERLYGRSGTVTSAMRLFFMAPGYGEGNIRTTISSLKGFLGKDSEAKTNLKYIVNSLLTTATLASVGTYIMTGKPPDTPKRLSDIRDVFKIKTGKKDGNGDDIYVDLMTFDRDFWALYGNALMGKPAQIIPDLAQRLSGATSTGYKILTDLSDVIQGRNVYDYKGTPIYYSSDTFPQKVGKFLSYELGQGKPISFSTFESSQNKSKDLSGNIVTSVLGIRPTTSERVREVKQVKNDIYTLLDSKREKQIELNKLAKENPGAAMKEMDKFNSDIKNKLSSIAGILGRNIDSNKFLIKKFNIKEALPIEEQVDKLIKTSSGRTRTINLRSRRRTGR